MNSIFPTTDNNLIYTILNKNQDTIDLVKMRLVCKKWRDIVDYVSCNLLLPLGIRVEREVASIRVFQITACFNRILRMESTITHIEKVRALIPHLNTVTQIKLIKKAFMVGDAAHPRRRRFSVKLFQVFMKGVVQELSDVQAIPTFKAVLINQSKDIVTAATFSSDDSFFYIYNKYKPSQEKIQEALYPSCEAGNFTLIHTLLDLGADPTQENEQGETYLTAACRSNCCKGVKLLMSKGADTERRNHLQEKPIAIAARKNEKIFELLCEKTKDLAIKFGPSNDKTLAHFAAEGNNFAVITHLLSKEIPIDDANIRGVTPLMIAIRETSTETFYSLLECGASLTKKCIEGRTPLDYAVIRDNEVFIEVLLERIQDRQTLYGALKTALGHRNTRAINMISKKLGLSTPIKYGSALVIGALVGGFFVMKYFDNGE